MGTSMDWQEYEFREGRWKSKADVVAWYWCFWSHQLDGIGFDTSIKARRNFKVSDPRMYHIERMEDLIRSKSLRRK